jgi:hypothetical protein
MCVLTVALSPTAAGYTGILMNGAWTGAGTQLYACCVANSVNIFAQI